MYLLLSNKLINDHFLHITKVLMLLPVWRIYIQLSDTVLYKLIKKFQYYFKQVSHPTSTLSFFRVFHTTSSKRHQDGQTPVLISSLTQFIVIISCRFTVLHTVAIETNPHISEKEEVLLTLMDINIKFQAYIYNGQN